VRDNQKLRRKMIANIVANVRVQMLTSMFRLAMTAAETFRSTGRAHFDRCMEDFGNMYWGKHGPSILTPGREYNVSS
jgi:hypothetical protein